MPPKPKTALKKTQVRKYTSQKSAHVDFKGMEELRYFWSAKTDMESPINIMMKLVRPLFIPKLLWYNVKVRPHRTKITNNGYTVFVTSKWGRIIPYISDGPLGEKKFLFYNIHFHWADNSTKGSEHKIDGEGSPFEMHVLWRNDAYKSARKAKKEMDGILIMAYLFQTSNNINPNLEPIVECLESIRNGGTSAYFKETVSISTLLPQYEEDFLFYRGLVTDSKNGHQVTWMVFKEIQEIGIKQLFTFRRLLKINGFPIVTNSRNTAEMVYERSVFHIRPPSLVMALAMQLGNTTSRGAFFCSIFQKSPFLMDEERALYSEEDFLKGDKKSDTISDILALLQSAFMFDAPL